MILDLSLIMDELTNVPTEGGLGSAYDRKGNL